MLTPGNAFTKSIVLRVGSGVLAICVVVSVVETVAVWVWISSVAPVTVTVSVRLPTARTTGLTVAATP